MSHHARSSRAPSGGSGRPDTVGMSSSGRWAIEELLGVRRVRGRGRGLEVHVRWEGEDAAGIAERALGGPSRGWVGVSG